MLANESIVCFIYHQKCWLMQKQFNREVLHHEKAAAILILQTFLKMSLLRGREKVSCLQTCIVEVFYTEKNWILCILAQWYMQEWYFFWYFTAMNPEEIDSILLRLQAGVDLAMQRAKAWSKYMKEITTYIEKKIQLGK